MAETIAESAAQMIGGFMLTPDTEEQGYNCSMVEEEYGARLTVRRKGTVIGEIAVGNFNGGPDDRARIVIRRFDRNELQEVVEIDEPRAQEE